MKNKFVVIDTETTGNAPKKGDKIIQIGAAVIENNKVQQTFSTFVRPYQHIPIFIQQLTGITDEDVQQAPSFKETAPQLLELLQDAYFVAHNVPFDLHFINQELIQAGFSPFHGPAIDTVECARFLYPTAPGYQLSQLAEWLHIDHDRPHQADSDAIVTAYLWLNMKKKLYTLPYETLDELRKLAVHMDSNLSAFIQEAMLTTKKQIEKDIEHYKGLAIKKHEPIPPKQTHFQAQGETTFTEAFFSADGTLSGRWAGFEYRQGQEKIADAVSDALENRSHLLLEAGTGIGKSLAYLVPVVQFSKQQGRRVVVSTNTTNLQAQLMQNDIPLLKKVLPHEFEAVTLKGKQHYLCLRKFRQLLHTAPATYEEVLGLAQVLVWILETDTGDVEEINIAGGSNSAFWEKVRSDESSLSWYAKNYYYRAVENAKHADVIVTNHALLFADVSNGNGLLPSYKHVVVDEAHHLEEVAAKSLGMQVDYFHVTQVFHKLGVAEESGDFQRLRTVEETMCPYFGEGWHQQRKDAFTLLKYEADELFRMLHHYSLKTVNQKETDIGKVSVRYRPQKELSPLWEAVKESLKRVLLLFEEEAQAWHRFVHHLQDYIDTGSLEQGLLHDFHAAVTEAEEMCDVLFHLIAEEDPNYVYWMEVDKKGAANAAYLYARPIDVSEKLADSFFAQKDSVILTSATLTVDDSFSYVMKKWGLLDVAPPALQLSSPFAYEKNARLFVPSDITTVKDNEQDFIQETAAFIYQTASITEGKMLVLFTSFDMLKKTYYQLKQWDEASDFALIAQGLKTGSRLKMMKSFQQYNKAILLGTNAFWEGIDIPGEDLSCLIIVRLPFAPPNEPVLQARTEQVKREGGSPFKELSLPQAVLRFKQGFGRLIRHKRDKGVVVVLDKRMMTSSYGRYFLQSIPALPVAHKPMDDILNDIADFLDS
ncbi:ATP-dependent DNA helicase DinG [Alteribacillus persepolensis]|uniref:3'-5' exonuclease DinG n=1 Tax=Alteribacillus persepolensis TaxID=568899 RepID=A0A1G7ZD64_9BACI|nr:ATP-dependent DNA helicase DinG [Alteribacillus persepolensis]SDH06589.1 ATP-dependent DNA helicase DinG [Alteribacillus persepolensis]